MPEFQFQEMFPTAADTTPYRKLSADFVGTTKFGGRDLLTVEPEALTLLTAQAFKDISHLLRPGHLAQLSAILDDPEASANDKYVALELLKNANISAGGVLPMCRPPRWPGDRAGRPRCPGCGSGCLKISAAPPRSAPPASAGVGSSCWPSRRPWP